MTLNAGVKSYQADIFESFLAPATQALIYGIEWDLFKEIFFLLQIIKYNRTHLEMLSVGVQNLNLSSLIKIHFVDTYIKHLKLFLNSSFWNTIRLSETHQFKEKSFLLKNAGAESKSKLLENEVQIEAVCGGKRAEDKL